MVNNLIIPAAGLGTRMEKFTRGKCSKLMLKLRGKPLIDYSLKEAYASDISSINVVVNNSFSDLTDFLKKNHPSVNLIEIANTSGSADSIYVARDYIDEPFFLVSFPDILIKSDMPAIKQLNDYFEEHQLNTLAWMPLGKSIKKTGEDIIFDELSENPLEYVKEISPKNSPKKVEHYIVRYIVSKNFFNLSAKQSSYKRDDSDILKEMFLYENFIGKKIIGKCFDCGVPEGYLNALENY